MIPVTTVTHSVQCASQPREILSVLLDPEAFSADLSFVEAVLEERSSNQQVVRFTAKVGENFRSWSSIRTIYEHGTGFRAVLDPPIPPTASMIVLWSVIADSETSSTVVVTHEIVFLENTSCEDRIKFLADLDINSDKELSHLRFLAERSTKNFLPASLAASLGGFLSRVTIGPSCLAGSSLFGDLSWVAARFSRNLMEHPLSEAFWDEWLMLWEQRGDALMKRSRGKDEALLRRAAGAYHWAQFLYFRDKDVKRRLRHKVKSSFRLANARSQRVRELTLSVEQSKVSCWLIEPEGSRPDTGFPWVMFINGLDSSSEIEPMMVAEKFANFGFATVIPELPGQGVSGIHSTLPPSVIQLIDDMYKSCESLEVLSTTSRYFGGISFGGQLALKVSTCSQTSLSGIVNLSGGLKPVTPLPRRLQLDFINVVGGTPETLPEILESFAVDINDHFQFPTLTIQGIHDDIYLHNDMKELHRRKRDDFTTLISLPDEGHCFLNDFEFGLQQAAIWLTHVESGKDNLEATR
mgnify:FL=1